MIINPIEQILFTCGLLCVAFGILIDDPVGRTIGILALLQFLILMIAKRR